MTLQSGRLCIKIAALLICVESLALANAAPNEQASVLNASNTPIANEENIMTTPADDLPTRSSSRIAAPKVEAVNHNGVRYEQLKSPSSEDLSPGGYVMVTDIATGDRLKIIKVYDTVIDPNKESDVQIVFFKKLELNKQGDALLIEDEKNRRYRVDLKTEEVQVEPHPHKQSFFEKILNIFN